MLAIHQSRSRGNDFREEARVLEADPFTTPNGIVTATQFADKACPVVFRDSSMRQILAFEHPEAGIQLVKGTIEPGEDARTAALRELEEEAGIVDTAIAKDLGTWAPTGSGQVWSLQLCTYSPRLPDSWTHHCPDDGGHDLRFFWHDMYREPGREWADQFQRALATIRERTRPLRWRG